MIPLNINVEEENNWKDDFFCYINLNFNSNSRRKNRGTLRDALRTTRIMAWSCL